MKKLFVLSVLLLLLTGLSSFDTVRSPSIANQQPGIPSNLQIGSALKQALQIATTKSANQLSQVDGYLGNPSVKILFPPEAEKVERALRRIGLGSLCDKVIVSMNRAAENAAKDAAPIFLDAIKHMTLTDVKNILLGPPDAATQYFKQNTTLTLMAKFKPVIQVSLDKVGATRYYGQVAGEYNKLPFVDPVNPDISDYATRRAIDGLFVQIALEELNIRQNLSARSTPLLKKVFSFAEKALH